MRQLQQNLKSGATEIVDVPVPSCGEGEVLIRSTVSLISPGTERMLVDFGKASLVQKARQQPHRVKDVLAKARNDGLVATAKAVNAKLGQPLPLGYSNVGVVVECGENVSHVKVGDRVVSNGAHAELVAVPKNLVARIPEHVSDDAASFTVVGAIALQGVRLAKPTIGETVAVIGLGLVGLLTVQILRANGCNVLGFDLSQERVERARQCGAQAVALTDGVDAVAEAMGYTKGLGIDAVLVTTATSSSDPVRSAAQMCRRRGRIVLVGVSGLTLERDEFFRKELSFQVSCSYGPGRYDPEYELKGNDYPRGFVRWTQQRNFEAILELLQTNALHPEHLVTHSFAFNEAPKAYEELSGGKLAIGMLLRYTPSSFDVAADRSISYGKAKANEGALRASFIGAGNYASSILIPTFARNRQVCLKSIGSNKGLSASQQAKKFGFQIASTDTDQIISGDCDAVVVSTRHNTHAELVCRSLQAGKHVFVEKPLCLTPDECDSIEETLANLQQPPILMVGFNRRFAPLSVRIKTLLDKSPDPKSFIYTINAGALPADHWTNDPSIGGGRVIGEACHFIDLIRFFANSPIVDISSYFLDDKTRDSASIQMRFADGSIGAVHYFSNGPKKLVKERLEIFANGKHLHMDNFRRIQATGWPGAMSRSSWVQDKGQVECVDAFVDACKNGKLPPIPVEEIFEVSRATMRAAGKT